MCHQSLVGSAKRYQKRTTAVDNQKLPYWSKVDGWGLPGKCHVPKENWTSFVSYPTKDKYFTPFAISIFDLRGSSCTNTLEVLCNARHLLPLPNKSGIPVRPVRTTGLGSISNSCPLNQGVTWMMKASK